MGPEGRFKLWPFTSSATSEQTKPKNEKSTETDQTDVGLEQFSVGVDFLK